jgi:hypothetical protein
MKPLAIGDAESIPSATIKLCREYAIKKFNQAQDNDIYVCKMQLFDANELMHGVIVTRDGLECHHPVEFEYYINPKIATALTSELCAYYCTRSSRAEGFVDQHLNLE